jgi:hypothetical protein
MDRGKWLSMSLKELKELSYINKLIAELQKKRYELMMVTNGCQAT